MEIRPLHEQRPLLATERRQLIGIERPMGELPTLAGMADQSGFDVVLRRQREQCIARERRREAGNGLADEERALVPVALHECVRREAAEQGRGGAGCRHEWINTLGEGRAMPAVVRFEVASVRARGDVMRLRV
ncbi:hypothetical protein [Pandoraea soli]|uniref:hypothetical protein n=1 Tax=Pandoraea soli TaxID=2508293 RepID=UPI0031B60F5D